MPAISLVICVYKETAMLDRLLRDAADCYDDLVVVHDGPAAPDESERIKQLVVQRGGRFFVRPRAFQQEPHWPFAWEQARHEVTPAFGHFGMERVQLRSVGQLVEFFFFTKSASVFLEWQNRFRLQTIISKRFRLSSNTARTANLMV